MATDIFKVFKKSIEPIQVKKTPRGTLDEPTAIYTVILNGIIKNRNSTIDSIENSEDYNSATTIHFKTTDSEYVELGNFVKIDGSWRSIVQIIEGKNFDTGKTEFLRVFVGNDMTSETADPVWGA